MRVLALYLPQYHAFKENNEWWGEGYTEWSAVKRAKPLFTGHIEPREPFDGIYYDLSDQTGERLKIQAEQAKKYGIYGFVFYQYYFTGHKLMERPMEILLDHPEIDLKYCISWANETWRRAWYDYNEEILMEQKYGDEEEWKEHFDYLLRFFKDERYIKQDGKPVLCIYRTGDIEALAGMKERFDEWAREAGFPGIYLIGGRTAHAADNRDLCDAYYYFEPGYSLKHALKPFQTMQYNVMTGLRSAANSLKRLIVREKNTGDKSSMRSDMMLERRIPIDWIYGSILGRDYADNEYPGIIARWDNTPRRGYKGLVYTGASAEKFKDTLCKLDKKIGKDAYVFVNAWNEWGEGAMLEPDKAEGYAYLEAVEASLRNKG